MLDYRSLTFLEVYRQRSYTQAARALLITQPAVSHHIHFLESYYGCSLFKKTSRGVEPTPAADMLYGQIQAMRNDEDRMRSDIRELASNQNTCQCAPLIFGCTRTIADYVAPQLVTHHLERRPGSSVSLQTGNTRSLLHALEEGRIDFALVEGSFDRSRFSFETLSRERYIAVGCARPQSSDAAANLQRPDSICSLFGYPLILREAGSGTREILQKHLAARDLSTADFARVIELGSIPAIKACVRAGQGISFMYRTAVERELANGELVDITPLDFEIEHNFCLIWQRGSRYAPRHRALCNEWRKVLAKE